MREDICIKLPLRYLNPEIKSQTFIIERHFTKSKRFLKNVIDRATQKSSFYIFIYFPVTTGMFKFCY